MSEARFSGKQVLGIVIFSIVLLAVGLVIGGLVGYQLGRANGQQVAQQLFNNANPRGFNAPAPFGQQLPTSTNGPYLGVQFEMITPEVAASEGITGTTGAIIRVVEPDSPASTAGIEVGDVIVAVDGQPVDDQHTLRDRIVVHNPGDEVTLTIVTGTANGPTDSHDVRVQLGTQPQSQQPFGFPQGMPPGFEFGEPGEGQATPQPQQPSPAGGPYLGVEFAMITPDVAATEGITGTTGALINAVAAGSPAADAGLKKGDVITAVDGQPVDEGHTLRDRVLEHKVGDKITLTVVTGTANGPQSSHEVTVTLGKSPAIRRFQLPPGSQPGAPSPDSRSG